MSLFGGATAIVIAGRSAVVSCLATIPIVHAGVAGLGETAGRLAVHVDLISLSVYIRDWLIVFRVHFHGVVWVRTANKLILDVEVVGRDACVSVGIKHHWLVHLIKIIFVVKPCITAVYGNICNWV